MVNPNMIQGNPQNPRMGLPQMNTQQQQQQPRAPMMQNMQQGVVNPNNNLMGQQQPPQQQQQNQQQQLVPPPPYPEPPPPYPGQQSNQNQVSPNFSLRIIFFGVSFHSISCLLFDIKQIQTFVI